MNNSSVDEICKDYIYHNLTRNQYLYWMSQLGYDSHQADRYLTDYWAKQAGPMVAAARLILGLTTAVITILLCETLLYFLIDWSTNGIF